MLRSRPSASHSEEPSLNKTRGPRLSRAGWAALLVLALAVAVTGHAVRAGMLKAALMTADPDAAATDPRLAAYAVGLARPAYATHCEGCHGASLRGDPARGVPDLTDADWLYGTGRPAEIERTVLYGIRSGNPKSRNLAIMPAFAEPNPSPGSNLPSLKPEQIADVSEFVLFLDRRGTHNSETLARGREVFNHQGGCYDCHGSDGAGDGAIGAPNLTDDIWLYGDGSLQSVRLSIARGRQGACPAWSERLGPIEVRALAIYLYKASRTHAMAGQDHG